MEEEKEEEEESSLVYHLTIFYSLIMLCILYKKVFIWINWRICAFKVVVLWKRNWNGRNPYLIISHFGVWGSGNKLVKMVCI